MPKSIPEQVVEQQWDKPSYCGSLACHLRRDDGVAQRHRDGRKFQVYWREQPMLKYWRCTIFLDEESEDCIAQIDLHDDGTVRIEAHEPVSIVVDPEMDLLLMVRFAQQVPA